MLRIGFVEASGGGGATRAAQAFARGLASRGHAVDVWSLAPDPALPVGGAVRTRSAPGARYAPWLDLGQLSICASPLGALEAVRLAGAWRGLARAVDAEGYDVVVTHACRYVEQPWLGGVVRAPVVAYVHALPRFRGAPAGGARGARRLALAALRPWYELLARAAEDELRAARVVVANSRTTARALAEVYGGLAARVVHPGVDGEAFRPLGLPRDGSVLYPALLSRQKRQELLIDALGLLPAARRPRLVLLHTAAALGFAERLHRRAAERGVELLLRRGPSERELLEAYNHAALVAFPAAREAFGLVPLEAMACGTPVVAAAEGGMLETVEDGVTGRLVPPTPAAFAAAIDGLLADAGARERLGAAGRARALERWSWGRATAALEATLLEVAR